MKKLLIILLIFGGVVFSQDSLSGQFKKHLTFSDTFFGNEEDYQVCYPKEHRTFFYGIFFASATAISLFIVILYIKSKHNKTLTGINKEINEKNKEILDSIRYAKRIQESILPTPTHISTISNRIAVLYKPRDIVSGDLYWIHKCTEGIYLAVIDCTGHGVPGAFLSLLAHNAIEQAIMEKGLTSPTKILDSMNTFIKGVLNQNNSDEISDGMEVGLCLVNDTKVIYAGANIKLKYFSNGTFNELKGAKCTVGSVQRSETELPKDHELKLNKGDRIFMHSDGIVDQFGGPSIKKFTTKSVNKLLEETSGEKLSVQFEKVKTTFENWKGTNEQTDDVLLLMYEI